MTKSLTRDYGIDIFRILCCIGVLIYHIFDDILYLQNNTADTIYFLAAYCVPGFFMLSGYLLAQKESITFEYSEKKIIGILSKLFGWIVFWSVIHFIVTGELTDLWLNFSHGAISGGTLPVSWFLFTYCMLMIIGYPAFQLMKKYKPVFICLCIIWVIALAFGVGNSTWRIKPQALWLHLYVGYFIWGMCLASLKKAADKKIKSVYQLVIALTVCVLSIYVYIYILLTRPSHLFSQMDITEHGIIHYGLQASFG